MQWHTLIVYVALSLLTGMGIWAYAYHLGFKRGQSTLVPFQLVDELLDHRIACLSQDPATARVEVGTLLGIEEWESPLVVKKIAQGNRDRADTHVYH